MADLNPTSKAFFLGPKSENEPWVRDQFQAILDQWFAWRKSLFPKDPPAITQPDKLNPAFLNSQKVLAQALTELNGLLSEETPTYSPRYLGHMVSESLLPALLGHFCALLHNPNNTSREVSRVGSVLETEAIAMLAEMIGFSAGKAWGHFTSGGTVANFEAIWRARFRMDHWLSLALFLAEKKRRRLELFEDAHMGWSQFHQLMSEHHVQESQLRPYSLAAGNPYRVAQKLSAQMGRAFEGPVFLVPGNRHFSWMKGANLFGFGQESFWTIELDSHGKMDVESLRDTIRAAKEQMRPILMVASIAGTTEAGGIDPLGDVQDYLDELARNKSWDIWHHVDAAYGGFLCAVLETQPQVLARKNVESLLAVRRAHSITIDPHKLGYVPYPCGAFLVGDKSAYAVSSFAAPYLNRQDLPAGKWVSTIEGSRSATGATATWLTGKTMGFASESFGQLVASTCRSCQGFREFLTTHLPWVVPLNPTDSNVFCFSVADKGDPLSVSNKKTSSLFFTLAEGPQFSVSTTTLNASAYSKQILAHVASFHGKKDSETLILIRCVFMNPFWANEDLNHALRQEFLAVLKTWHDREITT
ncbi:MAG: hypothetical protein KDD51_03975 [Bdellovibrionales bacterium]|nr:hypothetical protein [Bdellovibrionales bacterium]